MRRHLRVTTSADGRYGWLGAIGWTGQHTERFWQSVKKDETGCWLWLGPRDKGYGIDVVHQRTVAAHRVAYALAHPDAPRTVRLTRTCGNRACVRLEHISTEPRRGWKQTAEWVSKRIVRGPSHPSWKGNAAGSDASHQRARRLFRDLGHCTACGGGPPERHHVDGDYHNNSPENIAVLCRRCHMERDGRLATFTEMGRRQQKRALAARWEKNK